MKVYTLQLGQLRANCYIAETEPGRCVAIDIGGDSRMFLEFLKMKKLVLSKILLTHGHFDHTGGVARVADVTGAEVYIHVADSYMLESAAASLAESMSYAPFEPVRTYTSVYGDSYINDGDKEFKIIHTPGHSKGSVCYLCDDVLFTGDTLFCCSIGRTDFPGSDPNEMINSLKIINDIKGNYRVLPGHNEESTLDYEKKSNPYLVRLR